MSRSRFVLVSHLRSGTHLLRTMLESHPRIVCQTEVFNSDSPTLPYSLTKPTREILDEWVFTMRPPEISCVGFVLQAYHPFGLRAFPGIRVNESWADVWPLLAAMDDLRVIHLVRRNLLRRHLSHLMARETGIWHSWDRAAIDSVSHLSPPPPEQVGGPAGERPRLTLDAERLEVDFLDIEERRRFVRRTFQHHPLLEVTYETLCAEPESVAADVLNFLDLPARPLTAAVRKLERRSLSEAIVNYRELERRFAGSPWAAFFDD